MRWSNTFHKVARKVEFRSVFHALSWKFKILAIPNVLAHGKSYEHNFVKQCDDYKLCTKLWHSRSYEHDFMKKHDIINFAKSPHGKSYVHGFVKKDVGHKLYGRKVEFRSIFCAPSWKFKILAVPKVLAYGKS
ncbi:hypothetical protein BHE74_00003214 [Ensete ventricosum]|nr:hypothetical protein BHE74_00003214 [Ensete ventricosum]RZR75748.1 hypothetical protein BHM03_00000233 [Ensete ventricosum]